MKIRISFVSNSSSSSFVVAKKDLTEDQIKLIKAHISEYHRLPEFIANYDPDYLPRLGDAWAIRETDDTVEGSTTMNNFNMERYLEVIGVDELKVEFKNRYADWHIWEEA